MVKILMYAYQHLNKIERINQKKQNGGVLMYLRKISVVLLLLIMVTSLIGCSSGEEQSLNDQQPIERTITDMAGRTVTIPAEINKVYATHSIGTLFVYTLAPDKLVGWNYELVDSEKQYIDEKYYELPVLGRWKGTNSSNLEEILKVEPDIIINMGDLDEGYITESNDIENMLNIPVIMVDGSIANQADSYEFLGEVLGVEDRAQKLADYSRNVFNNITNKAESIKDDEKIAVYYAAGLNGLETIPAGSINTEVLDLVGGINIADPGLDKDLKRLEVSMEQLLLWDPELIILSSNSSHNDGLYQDILNNKSWDNISAVNNKNVYEIPYGPYDWFSQPPTILRTMGLQWLGNLLYPDVYNIDLEKETKDFFNLFFDYQLNDEEMSNLFKNTK